MNAEEQALLDILEQNPQNNIIRAMLARLLSTSSKPQALEHFKTLYTAGYLAPDDRPLAAEIALSQGDIELAKQILEMKDETPHPAGNVPGVNLQQVDTADSIPEVSDETRREEKVKDGPIEFRSGDYIEESSPELSLSDVGGLSDVKKALDQLIFQPIRRPDLFAKYGKKAGGGVLLYGPPGCGKTMIAKATAAELTFPFYNVRLENILSSYYGESEVRLAGAFEAARELRPCVLFIDELDSLGYSRARQNSERGRSLVETMLQQLDSIGSDNEGILVLAASNEPWDIDGALLRPGRFDRTIFVSPPDAQARQAILQNRLASIPNEVTSLKKLVANTELFSGADVVELVERALSELLEEVLETSFERPLQQADLAQAMNDSKATTATWLSRARNHVEFANVGGRWDDVQAYLKQRHVAKLMRQTDLT